MLSTCLAQAGGTFRTALMQNLPVLREHDNVNFSHTSGNEAFNNPCSLHSSGTNSSLIQVGATHLTFMAWMHKQGGTHVTQLQLK